MYSCDMEKCTKNKLHWKKNVENIQNLKSGFAYKKCDKDKKSKINNVFQG